MDDRACVLMSLLEFLRRQYPMKRNCRRCTACAMGSCLTFSYVMLFDAEHYSVRAGGEAV